MRECLVIDDDQDDQEIFEMCIKNVSPDIHCTSMSNGVDTLSMLNLNPDYTPDYIFLDVNMPKMKGIDCLKLLKEIERLQKTKIFMYSTTSDVAVLEESKRLGATEFIIKPSSAVELKEKMFKIFEIVSEINK